MRAARAGHTATRLENGVVLIAGGRDGGARLASLELYVPRLAYEAGPSANPRGWTGLPGSIAHGRSVAYGRYVAAATNSHNHLLVSYRAGRPVAAPLLEWIPLWGWGSARPLPYVSLVQALGQDLPELNSIRVDDSDDIWGVSSAAHEIIKISSQGKVLLRFGQRHVENPTDIALDRRGHVFVTDAGKEPSILRFDARGRFIAKTGGRGSDPGRLDLPHAVATDPVQHLHCPEANTLIAVGFQNLRRIEFAR